MNLKIKAFLEFNLRNFNDNFFLNSKIINYQAWKYTLSFL